MSAPPMQDRPGVGAGAPPPEVPALDDVAGEWVEAEALAHLPSLRNQRGQAHANRDLASLSWIAAPPHAFGYHTGVLRVDGEVPLAQRFRWRPWGVEREHRGRDLLVRSDTRMVVSQDVILWQLEVTNLGAMPRAVALTQDLFAMVSHSEVGWGWLYDVPWSNGNYHDFFTLERIRSLRGPYLIGGGARKLRLGRPRLPGIQRDEDGVAMLMDHELPGHVSPDRPAVPTAPVRGELRSLWVAAGDQRLGLPGPVELAEDTQRTVGSFELRAGTTLELEFRPAAPRQTGVILTHGNHPDSLQLGLEEGRVWFSIAGEREEACVLAPGRWAVLRIQVEENVASLWLDGELAASTRHWTHSRRWTSTLDGAAVTIRDTRSPGRASYAFDTAPSHLARLGAGAQARWELPLAPGETRRVGVVCAFGDHSAPEVAGRFPGAFAGVADEMRRLWRSMFTPGNYDFSGHLPVLRTGDAELARAYYMGALVVLYMRNLHVSATEPIFLTGGPRLGPTTTYYWDHAEWSRMYAMLEPAGLRSWLLRVLSGPYEDSFGIDARHGCGLGNVYSSNHYALFRLLEHYVCITGDTAFLSERAGPLTVAEHAERLAHGWRDRRRPETGGKLADFGGDCWRLLECVPNYVHVVASLNAAYVGMMRSLGHLLRASGREQDAVRAEADAAELAAGVLDLFVEGGRWQVRHPGRSEVIGHVLDFGLVAAALHQDLSPTQRREMVSFVTGHLVAGSWLRALSADDPIAGASDRPDHGAGGAFCAWPGVAAHGLAKLGRPDLALRVLRATPRAASGALWGQAMEILSDGSVRVAERGISNRDSIAAAATAEAVLSALFDVNPTYADLGRTAKSMTTEEVPGIGRLLNLRRGLLRPGGEEDRPRVAGV